MADKQVQVYIRAWLSPVKRLEHDVCADEGETAGMGNGASLERIVLTFESENHFHSNNTVPGGHKILQYRPVNPKETHVA